MNRQTILSHNTFWFQGAPFETDRPGAPDRAILSPLVSIYRALAPDVLCFQEVQDEGAFDLLAAEMDMPGRHTPGGLLRQYGGAAFWRCGRCLAESTSCERASQRMWQIVEVPAGAAGALRVCNVHLPSSRQAGAEAGRLRLRELACVAEGDARPDVIVGDFNERPGGPVGDYLTRQGYLDAAALTGQAFRPTGLGDGRGDYAWVDRRLRGRLVEYAVLSREDLRAAGAGKDCLSDHFPLWITVDVT